MNPESHPSRENYESLEAEYLQWKKREEEYWALPREQRMIADMRGLYDAGLKILKRKQKLKDIAHEEALEENMLLDTLEEQRKLAEEESKKLSQIDQNIESIEKDISGLDKILQSLF